MCFNGSELKYSINKISIQKKSPYIARTNLNGTYFVLIIFPEHVHFEQLIKNFIINFTDIVTAARNKLQYFLTSIMATTKRY